MRQILSAALAAACCLLPSLPAGASERPPAPLFAATTPLALTLSGPFERIEAEREKDVEYRGSAAWMDGAQRVERELKYEARGHFRRSRDICDHIPLWLDFDKDELAGTLFAGQNRLKLVVQCRDTSFYEDYLLREEQVYRMFRVLSDISLRTRLLRVTYVDTESGARRTQLAVLLQHHERLAERLGLEELEVERIRRARLDPVQGNLVALFMFMVSNTDFSMAAGKPGDDCCHNTKPLVNADGVVFPLPYDFDAVGYVDASYAQVPPGLGQRNVRDRLYRGYCIHNGALARNLQLFRDRREALLAIAGERDYLSKRSARNSLRFIERFYRIIDSEGRREREILGACLGPPATG